MTDEEKISAESPEHCNNPSESPGIGFLVGTGVLLVIVLTLVFATVVSADEGESDDVDIISVTLNPGEAVIIPIIIPEANALIINKRFCAAHIVSDSKWDIGTLEKWAYLRDCNFTSEYKGLPDPVDPVDEEEVEDG